MSSRIRNRHTVVRWLILPACVLASIAVQAGLAAQAHAAPQSTVTLEGPPGGPKTLHYEAVQNRTNEVTVKLTGGNYVVTDTNVNNSEGNCTSNTGGIWICAAANVTKIVIELGGASDTADLCDGRSAAGLPVQGILCTAGIAIDVTIDGGNGRDDLIGAGIVGPMSVRGKTTLIGGDGPDLIFGAEGGDTIVSYAEAWRDKGVVVRLPSQPENGSGLDRWDDFGEKNEGDTLNGFISTAIGGPKDDELTGNFFPNSFDGGPGADTIVGLGGEDTLIYEDRKVPLNVSANTHVTEVPLLDITLPTPKIELAQCGSVTCGAGDGAAGENDIVGDDVENITGGSGNDVFVGTSRPTSWAGVFEGGAGNDTLIGGPGPDVFKGGPGFDTATYASDPGRTGPVSVTIDDSADDGSSYDQANPAFPGPRDTVQSDIESVIGTSANDTLNGGPNADTLLGGTGEDTIDGGGGNDNLSGGDQNDSVKGAGGSDAVNGDSGNDSLGGGDGNDSLGGGDGDDSLDGGADADSFSGGSGTDSADYSSRLVNISVSGNDAADDGQAGEGDNVGSDVEGITGGSGDDSLSGANGGGTLNGGPGSDSLDGGGGPDALNGGSGFDTANYSSRSAPVSIDLGAPGGDGEAGENDSIGGDVERTVGGSASDGLTGGGGDDVFEGGAGNDSIDGGGGQDKIDGGAGDDTVGGGGGDDTVGGGDGNDALGGGDGNDALSGGDGDDGLAAGPGADNFSGGGGSDTVEYAASNAALTITFDGLDNDGPSGEADNVEGDVENLASGSGNDTIDSSGDGNNGRIDCGAGNDSLASDPGDIAINCESVSVVSSARAKVKISSSGAKMSKSGSVSVKVSCPGAALDPCVGTLTLKSTAKASSSAKRKAKALGKLGSSRFSIAPGQTKTLKIKLSKAAKRTINRKGKLRASATAAASGLDTVNQTITINAPKRAGGKS